MLDIPTGLLYFEACKRSENLRKVEKQASLQAVEFRRERVTYGNVTPLNTEKVTTDEVLEERSPPGGTGMPLFYFPNFTHIKVKPRPA
jgi:hypothetical protein